MKLILFFAFLAVANAIVLLPEDSPLKWQAGQCPSGYPYDGLFSSCALGDFWRVGSVAGDDNDETWDPSRLDFSAQDFDTHHSAIDDAFESATSSCAVTMPGHSVLYQPLFNLRYAHYKMVACARAWGPRECRVVIKDVFNRAVDEVRIRPAPSLVCSADQAPECINTCTQGVKSFNMKWIGHRATNVVVRWAGDASRFVDLGSLSRGQNFTISASDFASNDTNNGTDNSTAEYLPEALEVVWGPNERWVQIIRLSCDNLSVYPGQKFYDDFLCTRIEADDSRICEVADWHGSPSCPCEDASLSKSYCFESDGFVALPDQVYYLGLESGSCSCSFDNVCLVERDHFGVKWVESGRRESNATAV